MSSMELIVQPSPTVRPSRDASASSAASFDLPELLPGLDTLWRDTRGLPAIRIAVLDGPVDAAHPCFGGHRIDATLHRSIEEPHLALPAAQNAGRPPSAHGTHVASLLFARHECGVLGVAPHCSGVVLPVFRPAPDGTLAPCSQLDLARAIGRAIDAGAHILNISGGELSPSGRANEFLRKAIRQASEANVLVVSAVGNDGCECLHVPAALPGVLAVGALDENGRPLDSSNWADILTRQGVMAPGHQILGALPGGGVGRMTGSSFATPLVAGVAALLLSLQSARGQRPDPHAVARALVETATPCDPRQTVDCRRLLAGRLDIRAARSSLSLDSASPPPVRGSAKPAPRLADSPSVDDQPGLTTGVRPGGLSTRQEGPSPSPLVFALGELGYDFGCEARLDDFVQRLGSAAAAVDPVRMAAYLQQTEPPRPGAGDVTAPGGHEEVANALVWTLSIDATPVYAIVPDDQFASHAYDLLTDFLFEQARDGRGGPVDSASGERLYRVAIAGRLDGTVSLYNGTVVPVIRPVTRGLFNWDADALLESVLGPRPWGAETMRIAVALHGFLCRIYFELRNLGQTSGDRALNYAGTNLYHGGRVFSAAWSDGYEGLEGFEVEPSSICRPDSDCWDVKLTFFDPKQPYRRARRVYRYTIDVGDVLPVTIGDPRAWPIFARPESRSR